MGPHLVRRTLPGGVTVGPCSVMSYCWINSRRRFEASLCRLGDVTLISVT